MGMVEGSYRERDSPLSFFSFLKWVRDSKADLKGENLAQRELLVPPFSVEF